MKVLRWAGIVVGVVTVLVLGVGVAGFMLLDKVNLASFVAGRASEALGRAVTVQSVHVTPGRWLAVEATGVLVANAEGGTVPNMVELRRVTGEMDAWSVLSGPPAVRGAVVEGMSVLLEHAADGKPNWRFGSAPPGGGGKRAEFWSLRDVAGREIEVTLRTRAGTRLAIKVATASLRSDADDQPLRVAAEGTYQGTPLTLEAEVPSIAVYRRPEPVPTVLRLRSESVKSGAVNLVFDGTMEHPLDVDGAQGRLTLDAPVLTPIVAMLGGSGPLELSLRLEGAMTHSGAVWRLRDAKGSLEQAELTGGSLRVIEGDGSKAGPDLVSVEAAFARMDLNELLGAGERGKRAGADMSLAVEREPGTLIDAKVTAARLTYDALDASAVVLTAKQEPGRVAVDELTMEAFGTRVRAKGAVAASGAWGRVTAEVDAAGADVQTLRRAMGFGSVPLTGRLVGRFTVEAAAPTLNAAVRSAKVDGVVAMRGGAIAKSVVEQASTDVRSLLRRAEGMSAVSCLLAALSMQGGAGRVAPMRVRAADGVIAGSASFDLNRRVFDLTVASESETTGLFALDVPVRISGPFGNPSVAPAQLSAAGRAQLAATDDVSRLPSALQEMARRYACSGSRR